MKEQGGWAQKVEVHCQKRAAALWLGAAFPCPPLSHSLQRDESLLPFGSYHPPCCFSEMQAPSSDGVYFLVMQFSILFLLGAALLGCF